HVDLALHSRTVAQWSHRQSAAVEEGLDIFYEAMELDALGLPEHTHGVGGLAADQVEADIGQRCPYQRKDLAHEPLGGVDVWRMLEAPDEHQVAAFSKAAAAAEHLVHVGQHFDARTRCLAC